jgi:spermidine synthase
MGENILKGISISQKTKICVVTFMAFLGALLLFGLEPLVGRLLMPYYGGAVHVWLTCLMFFQAMLFLGYLYAHVLVKKLRVWHLVLIFLPLINLPLHIRTTPAPDAPLIGIIVVLLSHVALPFVALSTTAVVAQIWVSKSSIGRYYDPYLLYAASNAGSLAALLGYTFLAEPWMGLRIQSGAWTVTYILYAVLAAVTWFLLSTEKGTKSSFTEADVETENTSISASLYVKWTLLSILPSAFLLAVTNLIVLEIGSFPLTWIAPLSLYLCSFIVTFRVKGGVPFFLKRLWPEILLIALLFYLIGQGRWPSTIIVLSLFFLICTIVHGTLYELRPCAGRLTHFYLTIALGGWIGGASVSIFAPHLFKGLSEYPILLFLLALALFWPDLSPFGLMRLALVVITFFVIGKVAFNAEVVKFQHRSLYGMYRIVEEEASIDSPHGIRKLVHGATVHGGQLLDPSQRMKPIYYFYPGGGISEVYESVPSPRNMAVIGLGAGAAAAYANQGDRVTFYEIDPDNEAIARSWFTYLEECKGDVRIIKGDGRLSMQNGEAEGIKYDMILVDAFTGDGIPAHLLTREAIKIYLHRLAEDGLILFHISNRYYELRPVVKAAASDMNLYGAINNPIKNDKLKPYEVPTYCVVLARNPERFHHLLKQGWLMLGKNDGLVDMAFWTDDYINILAPLIERIRRSIRIRFTF